MEVPAGFPARERAAGLTGRRAECGVLDRLVEAVQAGESRALVAVGEPGVGKTVLLEYLAGRASGCQVARAAGVQSEMELAFAGLHQLCAPMLGRAGQLPVPQRDALRIAFGLAAGPPPDRFLVGLAVLSLLSEVAGEQPLICLIDDEQWLDQASAQALGFVARRLAADPVGLVFAAREPGAALAGLPELEVEGLREDDARALLDSALAGPIDDRVRDRIVAETQGNPLALLELPRGLTPAELAGGFGLPGAVPLPERIEESFRRQLEALPAQSRRLLLLAAAEPYGDLPLVWRAAGRLGIPVAAAAPAVDAGLVEFGARVRFRHPLLRSASYRAASVADRRAVHARAGRGHRPGDRAGAAGLAPGPGRGRAGRGGRGGAGAVRGPGAGPRRAGRGGGVPGALGAADRRSGPPRRAHAGRGAGPAAGRRVRTGAGAARGSAEAGPLDELQSARVDLLRGEIVFASGQGSDASSLLLKAAKRLEPLNVGLARETYLTAWIAALFAARLAGSGDLPEVSRAARALPPAAEPRPVDLVLAGLALLVADGPAAAAPTLRQAVSVFTGAGLTVEDGLRWGWMAQGAASALWDSDAWHVMLVRQLQLARDAGALERLPLLLASLGTEVVWSGDFAAGAALVAEADAVCEATGSRSFPFTAMMLASLRGNQAEAAALIEATLAEAAAAGQGIAVAYANWVAAILANSLGRYTDALAAARQASEDTSALYISMWALPELIEAAARTGDTGIAGDALTRLAQFTQAGGTDFGLGVEARCRALLSDGEAAESLYREAIDRLGRTRLRPELARAHLLYGEWLRREHRHSDAREQLRTAHGMLEAMGAEAFAERAQRELRATGETARKRTAVAMNEELTAQEAQIARLARDGLSNPEIGARLFVSVRTVQYHLGKVFTKLDISSRSQLDRVLPGEPAASRPCQTPSRQDPAAACN